MPDAATIIAIVACAISIFAAVRSWKTAQVAAHKDTIDTMNGVIEALKARVADLEAEIDKWKQRYKALCDWVRLHGLDPDDSWRVSVQPDEDE